MSDSTHVPTHRQGTFEPSEPFDWSAVDDPIGVTQEEIAARVGVELTDEQTKKLLAWIMASGKLASLTQMSVLERVMLWVGSGPETSIVVVPGETPTQRRNRRLAARVLVALYGSCPHAASARATIRSLAHDSGMSKRGIQGLLEDFRAKVGAALVDAQ